MESILGKKKEINCCKQCFQTLSAAGKGIDITCMDTARLKDKLLTLLFLRLFTKPSTPEKQVNGVLQVVQKSPIENL